MKCNFTLFKSVLCLLILMSLGINGFANPFPKVNQTNKNAKMPVIVRGIVKDKQGPLPGVSISIKGKTGQGTVTATDGSFSISVESTDILVFSMIGYTKKEVAVGNNTNLNILLSEDLSKLDEVVVVGYQKQSVRKATGAIQVIDAKQIQNLPSPSFESLLQGRVAGINIQNFSGEPGVRNTFTVRGNSTITGDLNAENLDLAKTLSTPLFIIDGIPLSVTDLEGSSATGSNYLAGINTNDIESIVVQKDAAATAIWGSRGANGVIVIKTKRGATGKPVVRFSYYTGVTERPELQNTFAGAEERSQKLDLLRIYGNYDQLANIPQLLSDSLNTSFNNATDWQDLFYKSGKISNYDVNVSAGNELLNYRLALNYYDEDGIVRNTGFKRYSFRSNFDFKLSPKVNTNIILAASRTGRKRGLGRGADQSVPISATSMPSSFVKLTEQDYDFYYGQYDKLKDVNQTDQFSIYSQTNVDIFKGLQYSFQGSISGNFDNRDRFQPAELDANGVSFASSDKSAYYSNYLANVLTFSKILDKHSFNLVGIQSFQSDQRRKTYIQGYNVPTDDIKVVQGIPQKDLSGYSDLQKSNLLSFAAQFSYDYKSKYILNASYRADASSRFGKQTKWGYFPATSLAWVASEESFLKKITWLDLFKVRASYGLSGNLPDNFYAPYNTWDVGTSSYEGIITAFPSTSNPLTQPNLTWNKSDQANIGADIYLFKNRINLTVDFYRKQTKNPILSFPFPSYTGYSQVSYNVPLKILNEGIDISLQTRNLAPERKLQWLTNVNFSFNKNRLAALPNGNKSFYADSRGYNQQLYFTVGGPVYGWAQMIYNGVYNNSGQIPVNPLTGKYITYFKGNTVVRPGFPSWTDQNGDYDVWSDEDKGAADGDLTRTGDPNPRVTGGIYNEFTYKNFSLSVLGTFTLGRDIINTYRANQFANIFNFGGLNEFAGQRLPDLSGLNYWTPAKAKDPNYNADFPSISPFGPSYYQFLPFSTMWNESGSYFKIKTITAGYTVNSKWLTKAKIKSARLYATMDNVYTFQSASVPDAELITPQGEYTGGGYPIPKKYTFGLEFTF
jgi:TonB-linked SusC/RagA family outer membrane protein